MATVENADPRWIVNDLGKVGTNVGRWHWSEQNVIEWCKKRLAELLKNQSFYSNDNTECQFTTISHVKGDATVANRKRKLIAFYQLDVSVGWKATVEQKSDGDSEATTVTATGKINMPYISDENDVDEFEIQVTLDSESSATRQQKDLKDLVYKNVPGKLRPSIVTFLQELKSGANVADKYKDWEEQMQKMQDENKSSPAASSAFNDSKKALEDEKKKLANTGIFATVKLTEKLRGPVPLIFDSFLDSNRVSMITRSPANIEKKVGGKISMFGNSVVGKIVELEENKKIVQDWRFTDWQESHFSKLTLTFEQQGDMTVVKLTHEKVPSQQEKRVESGWVNIFNGMKMMLGQVISSGF